MPDFDKETVRMNLKRDPGVLGLGNTVETRIFAGARAAWWIIVTLVGALATGGAAYYKHDERISAQEVKTAQHDDAIKILYQTRVSKEAADAQTQRILDRLDQMQQRADERWKAIEQRIDDKTERRP